MLKYDFFFRHFRASVTSETTLSARQAISYHIQKTIFYTFKLFQGFSIAGFNVSFFQLLRPNWSSMRLDDGVGREKDDKLAKAVKDAEKLMKEVQGGINMQNLKLRLFS